MKKIKITAFFAAAAMAGLLLTGCSGGSEKSSGTKTETNESGTQAQGTEAKKDSVVVVMTTNSEPESGFDRRMAGERESTSMSR